MTKAFRTFVDHLETTAHQWPSHHPRTAAPDKPSLRYTNAVEAALDEVEIRGDIPPRLTNHNVRHGCKILTRYCQIAATLAARDSHDIDTLRAALEDSRSFASLMPVAQTQNKLAARVEVELGLKPYGAPIYDYHLAFYDIADGYVKINDVDAIVAEKRFEMSREGKELYDATCAAHMNGALQPIFRAFIEICARDQNLFARTLE